MPDSSATSRILTLVFTDLADSTGLKTQRGDAAVAALIIRHRELITRLAGECSGRIIDWAGDGCFLTFETSSAGVVFALRLQQSHAEQPDLPLVRVGIHLGEITERAGPGDGVRVEGLAVDIAARIGSLARPGQVLMSSSVYHSARQRLGVEMLGKPVLWQTHGPYTFKGFDEPLDISEAALEGMTRPKAPDAGDKAQPAGKKRRHRSNWVMARRIIILSVVGILLILNKVQDILEKPEPPAARESSAAIPEVIRSLAVLPLDNLSGDPEQEYFTDGMAEAITSELAKIKSLKVVSRTSGMQFKDTELRMSDIGEQLGVEGVITGSVQRDGDQIKIIVHLVNAPANTVVWTDDYDGTITSVLALQSEVALAIADALQAELTGEERARVARGDFVDRDAYNEYLRGLHFRELGTREGILASVQHFERATQLDPNFAEAWGRLGQAYCLIAGSGAVAPGNLFPRARAAALKGLQLDGDLPSAHNALGICALMYDWEWEQAEFHLRRSIEVDPNGVFGNLFLASYLAWIGQGEEAAHYARKALELGSADPWVVLTASQALATALKTAEAKVHLEAVLTARPEFVPIMLQLAAVYEWMGDLDGASQMVDRAMETDGRSIASLLRAAMIAVGAEDKTHARALLDEALRAPGYIEPGYVYPVYVRLGELDSAFEWIEKGLDSKSPGTISLRTLPYFPSVVDNPDFVRFRNDPRYRAILDRLKFPALPKEHPGYADDQAWLSRNTQTTP